MAPLDIASLRLTAQHITGADFNDPADVVQHLLALQAQDYPGALWSIGLRTQSCTKADVEQAIVDRKIVRTWPMRGTLHFLHATDAGWITQLLAPRATTAAKSRRLSLGLTDKVMAEAEALLHEVLTNDTPLSRPKLIQLLSERITGTKIGNNQASHIFRNFGERGLLCFGPYEGKQPTFVLRDNWLPAAPKKERDEALGELARRYFTSHGPAQLSDLAGWAGIPMTDARRALELARTELETVVVYETTYYLARNLEPARTPSALLLPGFDEFLLGYKDRSAVLAAMHAQKIVPGNNGMFLPTIVVDGQVVGTWKRQSKKAAIALKLDAFTPSTAYNKQLKEATARYSTFLGMPVTLN